MCSPIKTLGKFAIPLRLRLQITNFLRKEKERLWIRIGKEGMLAVNRIYLFSRILFSNYFVQEKTFFQSRIAKCKATQFSHHSGPHCYLQPLTGREIRNLSTPLF